MSATEARYCPNCGAAHEPGANFCPSCGQQFADTEGATQPLQPAQPAQQPQQQVPQQPPGPRKPVPWVPIAIGGAIVVAGAALALVLLLRGGGDDSAAYKEDVATLIEPIGTANEDLAAELDGFTTSSKPGPALRTAREAARATRSADSQLSSLETPEDQQELRAAVDEALTRESDYLAAVTKALTNPSAVTAANLDPRAADARDHWSDVAESIPGAGGTISGVELLAKWARSKRRTGGGTTGGGTTGGDAATASFINNVESILAYSKPAVDRLSRIVSGMKAGTIDYTAAEAGITYAIDNRQEAIARASGLSAPNSASVDVKQLLVTALNRSLDNDGDYKDALQFYATEEVEGFDQAMRRAAASSGPASAAKQTFLSAYNALRRANGLGNTSYSTF